MIYLYLIISGKINKSPSENSVPSRPSYTVRFVCHTQKKKKRVNETLSKSESQNSQKNHNYRYF